MVSNKVDTVPQLHKNARAFQVTGCISTALRIFCLDRVLIHPNGEYSFSSRRIKCSIASVVILCCAICTSLNRWSAFTNNLLRLSNMLTSYIWTMQCILAWVSANLRNEDDVRAYYDTLKNLDKILNLKHETYKKNWQRCNLIFFGMLSVYVVTFTAEMMLYYQSWSSQLQWALSLTYYCCRLVVALSVLDYLVKLYLFRARITAFGERLSELANPSWATTVIVGKHSRAKDHALEQIESLSLCYCLLYAHCDNINKQCGYKLMLFYTNVILATISATYTMIAFQGLQAEKLSIHYYMIGIYLLDALEVNLSAMWIIEYVMSIERQFQGILLTLENAIANDAQSGGGGGGGAWRRLSALCRRRPVEFTACSFFKLNYALLAGVFGTMVTYTVTLIQTNKHI